MYLVDTNIWIEHFKKKNNDLSLLLLDGKVIMHDFILGELSLGSFKKSDRTRILDRLQVIEKIPLSEHASVLEFIQKQKLYATGIGWIDAHLLHACYTQKIKLITQDLKLMRQAEKLDVSKK